MGKRTPINKKARIEIAKICEQNDWHLCRAMLDGCMGEAYAPAHRHKRVWYYDKPEELLWDVKQWIEICPNCDHKTEYNRDLLEEIFLRERGGE